MRIDSRPARIEPDITVDHETVSMRFDVPIRATAVWAMVRAARVPIAFVYVILRLPSVCLFVCLFVELAFQALDLTLEAFDLAFVVLVPRTIQICDGASECYEHCAGRER